MAGGALRPRRAGGRAEADRAVGDTGAHRRLCAVASNRGQGDSVAAVQRGRGGLPALPKAGAAGAKRWPAPAGPPTRARSTGVAASRASATPTQRWYSSAWRPAAHGANRTGPDVHRGPVRRLALRRPLPGGLRLAADQHGARRRPRADRRLHHGDGALRAAGQQADPGRARRRARRIWPASWRCWAGRWSWWRWGRSAWQAVSAHYGLRPRPVFGHLAETPAARRAGAARLVPPEPAEHLHRQADRADVRRRVHPGPPADRRGRVRTRGRRAGGRTGCARGSGVTP